MEDFPAWIEKVEVRDYRPGVGEAYAHRLRVVGASGKDIFYRAYATAEELDRAFDTACTNAEINWADSRIDQRLDLHLFELERHMVVRHQVDYTRNALIPSTTQGEPVFYYFQEDDIWLVNDQNVMALRGVALYFKRTPTQISFQDWISRVDQKGKGS